MNQRLYDAAATLPEDELRRDRGAFFGSLLQTMNHIAVADTIWLHRFARHPLDTWLESAMAPCPHPASLRQPLADTLPQLRSYRSQLDDTICSWAGRLSPPQLAATLAYANTSGQPQARPFGLLVQHFFNHQTHHRGQATTLLIQAGIDIGVTDLLALIPNEAEGRAAEAPR
jgi:uncharacterized damage-inducible protein DinB